MFSRIKGAIDRSIAEEQARQKTLAEQRSSSGSPASSSTPRPRSVSRTNSTNSPRRKTKKPSQDVSAADSGPNPDPAVFEAAFVLDDDEADSISRAATPKPSATEKGTDSGSPNDGDDKKDATDGQDGQTEQNGDNKNKSAKESEDEAKDASSAAPAELSPQVKQRLRKLEKLEATYPGRLP
ncbi:hypothetical protein F4780DRAFT_558543 [Xylariomycetidae sp. FL0641]|nr:hypothetical protein F4780DRAFT_558543 [Xylariomycetidae sp. FL0641]